MAVNKEMARIPPDSDDEPILLVYGKERTAEEEVPLLPKDANSLRTTLPPQIPHHPYPSAATPYAGVPTPQPSDPNAHQGSHHPYPSAATPYAGVPVPQPSGPNSQQSSSSNVSVCTFDARVSLISIRMYIAIIIYIY